ncbi:MAG TPA: DUF4124 domain-containing protein [Rhodanobacteraceae bacterium]|nr:DUF4124 domain-containing protein [Rhodanobacteraceae bacterium]
MADVMNRSLRALPLACLLPALACAPSGARAFEVYRCTAADGAMTYQDKPCPAHQRQDTIILSDAPIVTPAPAPPTSTAPAPAATMLPPLATPTAPLPMMYACTTYDGEKKYLSDTLPAPYPVPLGAMGFPSRSLDQAYGGRDRLGLSAPEEARKPMIGRGPLIANAQVMVQDHCAPAPRSQVCDELRHRFDANHAKLRKAFPSEKPPFQQREDELNAQLKGC